jgi:hypothetical protein
MRIGINTGMVVVGRIGTDLHMEYIAIGDWRRDCSLSPAPAAY